MNNFQDYRYITYPSIRKIFFFLVAVLVIVFILSTKRSKDDIVGTWNKGSIAIYKDEEGYIGQWLLSDRDNFRIIKHELIYTFTFPDKTQTFTATFDGDKLTFDNNTFWTKDKETSQKIKDMLNF